MQRALGYTQTGSSGGAGHGQGLAKIQCGWSRVYRAATSDMEAGTQSYRSGEPRLAMLSSSTNPGLQGQEEKEKRVSGEVLPAVTISSSQQITLFRKPISLSKSSSLPSLYELQVFKMELELERHRGEEQTNRTRNTHIWLIKLP